MLYQAPDHLRHKLLAAHLSPELRGSHIVRSLPVRSGDTVRIMRGDHKGFEGKITRTDREKYRIYVEGLTREKVDGSTIFVPIHPSKVMVTRLNLDDKWRKKILERKKGARKKVKEVPEVPKVELVEKPPEVAETKEAAAEEFAKEEKPKKKKVARRKRKTTKEVLTEKAETKAEEVGKKEKPKVEKKRTRRKTSKKTGKGEE
jgi:large subunit ribosomal protein L24